MYLLEWSRYVSQNLHVSVDVLGVYQVRNPNRPLNRLIYSTSREISIPYEVDHWIPSKI